MPKTIIGVMGPGDRASETDLQNAFDLGALIAAEGWVLLTGGRNAGVMDAASRGAKSKGGITVGVLPGADNDYTSDAVDIAILTDMGSARNNINVLSSDVVIACGIGAGTASEIALAIKDGKTVVLLNDDAQARDFFKNLNDKLVHIAENAPEAIALCRKFVGVSG